jgi:signal transduction histidine kinase
MRPSFAGWDNALMPGRRPCHWGAAVTGGLRSANTYAVDSVLAAVVAVPVSVQFANASPGGATPLGALLNAGTVLPLIWRRRAPFAVAVTVSVFAALVSVYARPGQAVPYGALLATYTVADLGRRWQRWSFFGGLVLILGPGALLVKHYGAADFLLDLLLPLSAYLLGTLARISRERAEALEERAEQLARGREADVARAAAEERARIARDMHDLLAHAVSIMVVQAEAAPVVVRTDPDRAERAFDAIAEAGREAMAQLRRLLGVLKEEQDAGVRAPPPTVSAVPALVTQMDSTSLRVDLRTQGEPRLLPADAEVAAYRIVQEALTNTVKHAGADSVIVRLDWKDASLLITVTDDGRGPEDAAGSQAGGHGLIGIQERVAACGGHAETGAAPGGGFQVTARLPYIEKAATGAHVPLAGAPDGPPRPAVTP